MINRQRRYKCEAFNVNHKNCVTKLWSVRSYFLYLYMVSFQHCFYSEQEYFLLKQTVLNVLQKFQTDWVDSSTKSSIVIQKSCSIDYLLLYHPSCTSVLAQLLSLTLIYIILGVKLCSPTFLILMSSNCRPPSHQSFLCTLHFSPFLIKLIYLAMCIMCLVSLSFLAIHISDLLSK